MTQRSPSRRQKAERLAEILIEYVDRNNLSAAKLGKMVGVTKASVLAYLDGVSLPEDEVLAEIAKLLNMTRLELYAVLEGEQLKSTKTSDQLCQEIRALSRESRSSFLEVYQCVASIATKLIQESSDQSQQA